MRLIAFVASLLIGLQILIHLITGSSVCLNAGCTIVEKLSAISPLYVNVLGLIFFQVVFWLIFNLKPKTVFDIDLISLVLVSGMVFDAALMA